MDAQTQAEIREAFKAILAVAGVNITCGAVTKQCISGAVDRKLAQKLHQSLPELATQADMLDEDYAAMNFELNKSKVTLHGEQLVIVAAEVDDFDPITHMLFKADH